ncbi:hypothetical protein D3C78_1068870 [compost metagenome]
MEDLFRVLFIQRCAVNHDHATGGDAFASGACRVADVGIGHMHGQVVAITLLAPVDPVQTFGGTFVTFTQLGALGLFAQGNAVGFQWRAATDQLQASFRLDHQDLLDRRSLLWLELQGRGRHLLDRPGHDRFGKRCLGHRSHTEAEKGKQPAHETISLKTRCWVTR